MTRIGFLRKVAAFPLYLLFLSSSFAGQNPPSGLEQDIQRVLAESRVTGKNWDENVRERTAGRSVSPLTLRGAA